MISLAEFILQVTSETCHKDITVAVMSNTDLIQLIQELHALEGDTFVLEIYPDSSGCIVQKDFFDGKKTIDRYLLGVDYIE